VKKFRLLLLDADVVIDLFALGIWDSVLERCEVYLAGTILQEAHFYVDEHEVRQDFDLKTYAVAGKLTVFDVVPSELAAFKRRFDPQYLEKLDPGETESLAYLLNQMAQDFRLCSADKIVYRVLGALRLREKGISLEEVLEAIGYGRQLPRHLTKAYREQWTTKGFVEGLSGVGLRTT
jgi:hypothetical protein